MSHFNPAAPNVTFSFNGDFKQVAAVSQQVHFGPATAKQYFHVIAVTDAATGAALPKELFSLTDVGCDGGQLRLVSVAFNGPELTVKLAEETDPPKFLARLKSGLRTVHSEVEESGCLEESTLKQVLSIYNEATQSLRGTYAPMLASITQGKTFAIRVHAGDCPETPSDPKPTATLFVQPRVQILQ